MNKKPGYSRIVDDSLEVLSSEIEDLENDELSPEEAGFITGYEEEADYEWWAADAAEEEAAALTSSND